MHANQVTTLRERKKSLDGRGPRERHSVIPVSVSLGENRPAGEREWLCVQGSSAMITGKVCEY